MPSFSEIPQNIREHLVAPRTITTLDEIQKKAEIYSTGKLSELATKLVLRDILPQDFSAKLEEEVGVKEKEAKTIARELKEKVLEPVRYALVNWGVDINQIDIADAPTLDEFLKEREEKLKKQRERLAALGIETEEEEENETEEVSKKGAITFDTLGAAPFGSSVNIHPEGSSTENSEEEEKPLIILQEEKTPAAAPAAGSSKSFSMPFGFFKKTGENIGKTTAPIRARVETPSEKKRTVHYSESRTPVSPFEKNVTSPTTNTQKTSDNKEGKPSMGFWGTSDKQGLGVAKKEELVKPRTETPPTKIAVVQPEKKDDAKQNTEIKPFSLPQKKVTNETLPTSPVQTEVSQQKEIKKERPNTKTNTPNAPLEKKPWGFSLVKGFGQKKSGEEKKEPQPKSELGSFFSGIKKDIDAEKNSKPKEPERIISREKDLTTGPQIEGNIVDLR